MRKEVYLFGFLLVSIAVLLNSILALILLLTQHFPGIGASVVVNSTYVLLNKISYIIGHFGHPVPPFLQLLLPRFVFVIFLLGTLALVVRRSWIFTRDKSFAVPVSFTRIPYIIFTVSAVLTILYFGLWVTIAVTSNVTLRNLAFIAALPAFLLLPVTVCWVEMMSFRDRSAD